jgi:hypothetical protein
MIYFPTNLESFSVKINLFSKELRFFFKRTAKIKVFEIPAKFLSHLLREYAVFSFFHLSENYPFFKRGRKDRQDWLYRQEFFRKNADNQRNISPLRLLKG